MLRVYTHSFALSRLTASKGKGEHLEFSAFYLAGAPPPPSAAASPTPRGTRWLHEWCCGPSSLISSQASPHSKGCGCQRTTIVEDGTSSSAVTRACNFMSHHKSLLWASMPCTGGSTWNFVNITKPGGAARRRGHINYVYLINCGTTLRSLHDEQKATPTT